MPKYSDTGTNWNRCGTKYNPPENWQPVVKAVPAPKVKTSAKTSMLLLTLASLSEIFKGGNLSPRGFALMPKAVIGTYIFRKPQARFEVKHSKPWTWRSAPRHVASRQSHGDGLTNYQRVQLNQSK